MHYYKMADSIATLT